MGEESASTRLREEPNTIGFSPNFWIHVNLSAIRLALSSAFMRRR